MWYRLCRGILKVFLFAFYWPDIRGRELVPASGPLILCSNHISWWDPVIIGCLLDKPVHFMAKEELFKGPLGLILPAINAFPVKRGTPDRKAIRRALQVLEEGGILGLFPEGTRSKAMVLRKAEPGAALLGARSNAPLVPVGIRGPYRLGRRVRVRVGFPFHLKDRDYETGSALMMDAIASLLEEGDSTARPRGEAS
ncbi:MAG: lysophospholipid acyltransferase family protein [Bacillota bacterium]|jgi:1-acyl-sn-glycerol-3-phosphate acyltransferase